MNVSENVMVFEVPKTRKIVIYKVKLTQFNKLQRTFKRNN